jgi:molybdate transport system ATP-binding protein
MTLDIALNHRHGDFEIDLGVTIETPGVTALFGPSGAGKSTVMHMVAGLLRPQAGRIAMDGTVLVDTAKGIWVPPHRRRVGCVFQDARLFPHMTVRRNLLFGWRRTGKRAGVGEIDHLIALLGIEHLLTRLPAGLSGGERQRVALGRAILGDPSILLLDEPLAALDAARKAEIMPYLERIRDEAGLPIVYVSHAIDEVARLADRMIVLDKGRAAATGSVFDIMSRLDLFPLTGRFEAGAVLDGRVAAHDPRDGLSDIVFDGGRLVVPRVDQAVGETIRVRIRARDIVLARQAPSNISVNNMLPATVVQIREDPGTFADVQLICGPTRLVARITRRSARRLGLAPGVPVHALIKTVTIDRRSLAPAAPGTA